MKHNSAFNWLIPLISLVAALIACAGLFSQGGDSPFAFTTLHGQTVQIYGKGLYRFDTVMSAASFKGVNIVTLVLSIPLLTFAFIQYSRNYLRGGLLLISAIPYFLYIGASMTFSIAFNRIFLLYAALLSVSLFTFIVASTTMDLETLPKHVLTHLPHRGIAIFMFIVGVGTFLIWLSDLVSPMLTGETPVNLGPYTTMFTHGFDIAVITPAMILTGTYLLQRKPLGYLLAPALLVFCAQNGFTVLAATISQMLEGIVFPVGVYIGMVGSWVVMGAFAIGLTIQYFRNIKESAL